jgi:CheY-like chemotaxis protein
MNSKLAILCVDDERIILDSLKAQIEKKIGYDYLFEYAESPEEALEIIDDLIVDEIELILVISDYQMPGMKGDEFATILKSKLPTLNIILLTGQITEDKSKSLVNQNIILKVIQKPWKETEIIEQIKVVIPS